MRTTAKADTTKIATTSLSADPLNRSHAGLQGDSMVRGARVFISCGQSSESGELVIAREIAKRLKVLGFEPYVALQEQSLRGIKENIFRRLEESEYFLFVDFRREALVGRSESRGSLFSHQELSIASFLDLPLLAFQEEGVQKSDGLMGYIQANSVAFSCRDTLPDLVENCVLLSTWDVAWRFELVLERDPFESSTAWVNAGGQGTFYHIDVRNRHRLHVARNCLVYLSEIREEGNDEVVKPPTVEFKWAGYVQPNAHIVPNAVRSFDAFWVLHGDPAALRFSTFSDSTEYIPSIRRPGRFELTYTVVSDNFPTTQGRFVVELGARAEETSLSAVPT